MPAGSSRLTVLFQSCFRAGLLPIVPPDMESGVLQFPAITTELPVPPFIPGNFHILHFGAWLLGTHVYNC